MNTDIRWELLTDRLDTVRQEARTRHLLRNGGGETRVNLWARLLPPLRRLESWLERHSGREYPGVNQGRVASR